MAGYGHSVLNSRVRSGAPTFIVLLLIAVVLVSSVAIGIALASAHGSEPRFLAAWRHAWQEAGYRAGQLWAEFVDWLRSR